MLDEIYKEDKEFKIEKYLRSRFNLKEDTSYLVTFYENLLLDENNNLHSKDLMIEELFDK